MKQQIAIFGSAFNPPTIGHLSVINHLLHFDKILIVPSIAHAWGKQMLDFQLRCSLVETFISDIASSKVEACFDEEQLLGENKAVTTYMLLSHLQNINPDAELTFVIGPDNLLNFSKFSQAEEIVKKWKVLACPETVQVRSSTVREAIKNQQSIDSMLTKSVAKKIIQSHCYQ
ncbi:nicotinate-nicotinamide nucleotide adenylyltransferase [Vibrio sp. SS-MA-C1-2]|uniref:nicotinate-nicotinamide nucleotide adenylyltransferase n=1 Tax=Vibrio sp. SS-MA-C1-2 TaxID=2908646 RepID=UPI001F391F50|nr:nicotinate-nicotinamide nucleotide adenylyltransferase [Vibrio sp. SS-MA-C1-2]UJF17311.1 nicotinate-nicotinamide nucleotide adenylyltransferase [Vibrio sp. SS-MA-C1-2]